MDYVYLYLRSNVFASITTPLDFQVVNALLTQLDKLKHHRNVLIMSTSNLPKAIGLSVVPSQTFD
jgi:AAA+ superfamily predicted ATPase